MRTTWHDLSLRNERGELTQLGQWKEETMHYIASKKLNNEPLHISISGYMNGYLFSTLNGHRDYIWEKLQGSGVNRAESNRIADALRMGKIVFVRNDDRYYDRAYINGVLVETPTQHITWNVAPPVVSEWKRFFMSIPFWQDEDADYNRMGAK